MMISSLVLFTTSTLLITSLGILLFSFDPYMIGIAMFLIGIGAGGENAISNIIFVEFCPPSKRIYFTLLGLFWGLGGFIYSGFGLFVNVFNDTRIKDYLNGLIMCTYVKLLDSDEHAG
jgi:MFS family permease